MLRIIGKVRCLLTPSLSTESKPVKEEDMLPKVGEAIPSPDRKEKFTVKRKSDGKRFAMKCEKMSVECPVIEMDMVVMTAMKAQRSKHFLHGVERGKIPGRFQYIVMKMLGQDLYELQACRYSYRFTLNTSLKLAHQCLVAIENLHRAGFLHRDVKPHNFAVGRMGEDDYHTVFMLDFGLAREFTNEVKTVRAPRDFTQFRGTLHYASIAANLQMEQSRKDDLESMMYMVLEWTSGNFPWSVYTKHDVIKVLCMKEDARTEEPIKEVYVFKGNDQ